MEYVLPPVRTAPPDQEGLDRVTYGDSVGMRMIRDMDLRVGGAVLEEARTAAPGATLAPPREPR